MIQVLKLNTAAYRNNPLYLFLGGYCYLHGIAGLIYIGYMVNQDFTYLFSKLVYLILGLFAFFFYGMTVFEHHTAKSRGYLDLLFSMPVARKTLVHSKFMETLMITGLTVLSGAGFYIAVASAQQTYNHANLLYIILMTLIGIGIPGAFYTAAFFVPRYHVGFVTLLFAINLYGSLNHPDTLMTTLQTHPQIAFLTITAIIFCLYLISLQLVKYKEIQ